MHELLATWFSLSRSVDRRMYALSGAGLIVFKYAVDCAIVWALTGAFWSPLGYLHPALAGAGR